MPTYPYACSKCGHSYEEFRLFSEPGPKRCPECKARPPAFSQVYAGADVIAIVRGNPKTFGQQAEENAKRLGKEQMALMAEQEKAARKRTKKLPKNFEPLTTTPKTPFWRDGSMGPKMDQPLDMSTVKDTKKYIETGDKA